MILGACIPVLVLWLLWLVPGTRRHASASASFCPAPHRSSIQHSSTAGPGMPAALHPSPPPLQLTSW